MNDQLTPERLADLRRQAERSKTMVLPSSKTVLDLLDHIDALQEDLAENYVPKGWTGLTQLLDEIYPEDFIPTRDEDPARDAGPRIVSLVRLLDCTTRERDDLQARLDAVLALHRPHDCSDVSQECYTAFGGACIRRGRCIVCKTRLPCPTTLAADPSLAEVER